MELKSVIVYYAPSKEDVDALKIARGFAVAENIASGKSVEECLKNAVANNKYEEKQLIVDASNEQSNVLFYYDGENFTALHASKLAERKCAKRPIVYYEMTDSVGEHICSLRGGNYWDDDFNIGLYGDTIEDAVSWLCDLCLLDYEREYDRLGDLSSDMFTTIINNVYYLNVLSR